MLDETSPGFNLSFWVGIGGLNDKGDVMLIQAMLNFISEGHGDPSMVGVKLDFDLPDVTGSLDSSTIFSIIGFQNRWMRHLLASVAGKIFPVDYKKYKYTESDTRRPVITMLHQLSLDAAGRLNESDYTEAMPKMFPQLRAFIKSK
jgi:hypothetical protein